LIALVFQLKKKVLTYPEVCNSKICFKFVSIWLKYVPCACFLNY